MKILIIDDTGAATDEVTENIRQLLIALKEPHARIMLGGDLLHERLPELGAAFKAELLRALEPPPVWYENDTERAAVRPSFCGFSGYDGRSAPTCWKGRGCASCLQKFKVKQSHGRHRGRGRR